MNRINSITFTVYLLATIIALFARTASAVNKDQFCQSFTKLESHTDDAYEKLMKTTFASSHVYTCSELNANDKSFTVNCAMEGSHDNENFVTSERFVFDLNNGGDYSLSETSWSYQDSFETLDSQEVFNVDNGTIISCEAKGCTSYSVCDDKQYVAVDCSNLESHTFGFGVISPQPNTNQPIPPLSFIHPNDPAANAVGKEEFCQNLTPLESHLAKELKVTNNNLYMGGCYVCTCTELETSSNSFTVDCSMEEKEGNETIVSSERLLFTLNQGGEYVLSETSWGWKDSAISCEDEEVFYFDNGFNTGCKANGCTSCIVCDDRKTVEVDCDDLEGFTYTKDCSDGYTGSFANTFNFGTIKSTMAISSLNLSVDMDSEAKDKFVQELISQCEEVLKSNPGNRSAKYCKEYLESKDGKVLDAKDLMAFHKCIKTGLDNPDSGLGCYAMTPLDYSKFGGFFDKVIRDYHGDESGEKKHITDWNVEGADYNVKKLGQDELSMRVRVGRNLIGFNLPGEMDKEERIKFEQKMLIAFDQLKEKYGGQVHSLTPDFGELGANPNLITKEDYQALVDAQVMFKDMDADPYLKSAGIASDWPYGRGCWQSDDKMRIIWFGEEDQLRIMCMKKGSNLLDVFSKLNEMLKTVESIDGIEFAQDDNYGYVTSCPSNLGTGMRASVHIKIPNLTKDGTDTKAKEVCKPLGLSVRGIGGEHTPIGADGTVDISPSSRLFIKEKEIIGKLYEGIEKLMAIENAYR